MRIFTVTFLFALGISSLHLINAQRQAQCCEQYCYAEDHERVQAAHFATKTSYTIAKGPEAGRQYLVPNCSPKKMWILSRHGTRLPESDTIASLRTLEDLRNEIIANYEQRHSRPDINPMCENDLNLLKRWRWDPNITAEYSEFLTTQGWNELKFLAIRYQRAFPNIMENIYDRTKFAFRYTNTQRTEASYKAFVEGLFGPNAHEYINVPPPPQFNDTLLRPYDSCPALDAIKTKGEKSEFKKFLNSNTVKQMISDVSQRLGYKFPLKWEQIETMFDACAYEQAFNLESPSPWCAAFTPSQINDIEYMQDLKKYYKSSYGNKPITGRVLCAAVNDMLHHLQSNDDPRAIVYFTHSKAILLFLTAMNVAKDSEPLRADNYYSMSRRKWRTSEISPFASNFAAIKFDCPNEVEREKVMFFLNEKPLNFDWCKVGLCNWSDIKQRYREFTDNPCEKIFCTNAAKSLNANERILSLITIALAYFIFVA